MGQYTVYGISADAIGDPVEEEDCAHLQAIIREELIEAGIDGECSVYVGSDGRHSALPRAGLWPELDAAIERAWARFERGE